MSSSRMSPVSVSSVDAALAEPGAAMIDRRVHDSGARDESAQRAEVLADAGHRVAEARIACRCARKFLPTAARSASTPRVLSKLSRVLERAAVHLAEHDAAVDVGDAIVVAADDAIGVRHADARLVADVALRAQDVVERAIAARRATDLDRPPPKARRCSCRRPCR